MKLMRLLFFKLINVKNVSEMNAQLPILRRMIGMNCHISLNLIHNYIINIKLIFVLLSIALSFTACKKDDDIDLNNIKQFPCLKVENQLTDYWRSIERVSLVGYEFDNLNISPNGDSQTFTLNAGMPGGFEDINIEVVYIRYSGVFGTASIEVDFEIGQTTTITLTGCSGAEGCPGIYLE